MKKLIIQIPAYNEEETIHAVLSELPRKVEGFDRVEWLLVDDGSADNTSAKAISMGIDHLVRHTANLGLARAFASGIDACLRLGADVIVNTDADNQYCSEDIPALVKPILEGRADIVIGNRGTDDIEHFSWLKKRLQNVGSWVVRKASRTDINDATSGFRALSRTAALKLNIVSDFTYTLESIIEAGHRGIAVSQVPVRTNYKLRESRLFKSLGGYIARSSITIIRIYSMYQPLKVFLSIGALLWLSGFALGLRFLFYYFTGQGTGHIQSLLLGVLLLLLGFQAGIAGLLADLIRHNRRLIEDQLYRTRMLELSIKAKDPSKKNIDCDSES